MADRILEGLWDCPYCGAKGIGGLTKHCPNCGHPQDDGTKFYMGEKKNYLDEERAKQFGKGADWVCAYCGSLNRVHYQYCSNCAAPKDSSEKDYFTEDKPAPEPTPEVRQPPKKKRTLLPILLVALAALLIFTLMPKSYSASVDAKAWSRLIEIERLQTLQESDWSVPDGGRVLDEKTELARYRQVLDHYEERSRQASRQVYDGEDVSTSYVDNGDGTFREQVHSTPRYRTEWYTEYYTEPVYRNEPVYATKYYYEIDRWMQDRIESASGEDDTPHWPEFTLGEKERTGRQQESYILTISAKGKSYRVPVSQELWERYRIGDGVNITVTSGNVVQIDDQNL